MSSPGQEFVEVFLQEASEHLQFLREYGGILLDPYPAQEDLERLYLAAHTLKGSSGMYGFPLFSEVAGKLTHIFQYAMNVGIGTDAAPALVEFVSEAVAVLESDLWMISANASEADDDIAAFKAKYPFAFQTPAEPQQAEADDQTAEPAPDEDPVAATEEATEAAIIESLPDQISSESTEPSAPVAVVDAQANEIVEPTPIEIPEPSAPAEVSPDTGSSETAEQQPEPQPEAQTSTRIASETTHQGQSESASQTTAEPPVRPAPSLAAETVDVELPPDGDLPAEILEFFVPEVEEHLQTITECLLALETNATSDDIHRLFRAMHTIKGSAAQVGLPRIALVAHRAEDLAGKLRDGALTPSAEIVDICLESVDTLKKFLYRQWPDEATAQSTTKSLLARIARLAPEEKEEDERGTTPQDAAAEATRTASEVVASADEPFSISDLVSHPGAAPVSEIETEPLGHLLETGAQLDAQAVSLTSTTDAEVAGGTEVDDALAAPAQTADCTQDENKDATPPRPTVLVPEAKADVAQPRQLQAPSAAITAIQPKIAAIPVPTSDNDASARAVAAELEPLLALKRDSAAVPMSRSVRIALERLDRMMNAVGELVINRTRMLGRVAELERLADVLNFSKARMSDKINEFQEKYEFSRITGVNPMDSLRGNGYARESFGFGGFGGNGGNGGNGHDGAGEAFPFRGGYSSYAQKFDGSLAEFSELEMDRYDEFSILSRSLTEISADITEILTQLDGFVRRVDSDIDEFTKLAHRLQDEITAARMVPIGNLYTRISRTVRDAAKAAGKQVELQLAGAETELDNNIIQQIADPLLHLVRNSVAHGIEWAEERYGQGKPDNGTVYVRAYHRGNQIYIEVEDDGRGLDYAKIRAMAVELGFATAARAEKLSERDLQNLLFQPGFSTAPRKTELAGRGVGLDVVRANLTALNGEIEVETQKGLGTRFTLKVPLTLIISQALFVRCGESVFAFPLAFVEEIRRIRQEQIEEVGGKLLTKVRDVVTEVVCLDRQLGLEPVEPLNGYFRLVIVNVAGRQVGIVVEEVLRKDEIVIKNLGEYLRNVKLFPGATIAPDGSLILLVDVNRLIAGEAIERRPLMTAANAARLFFPGASALASGEVPDEAIDVVPEEKVVVLADDSISVRKFVGRMLEKAGFRVRLACDGLEALEIVSQTRCDLVVTDLEMPRTNGYELMAHLKQNPETRDVPVMVVTSRAGAKHRDKALMQGAAEFLVKPVQEEQFVAAVERLIGRASEARATAATAQHLQGQP